MVNRHEELRDHFAGLAMAAQIAAKGLSPQGTPESIAKQSYEYAAAMLKESNSKPPRKRPPVKIHRISAP